MKLATFEIRSDAGPLQRLGLVMTEPALGAPRLIHLHAAYAWLRAQGAVNGGNLPGLSGSRHHPGLAGWAPGESRSQAAAWADFLIPHEMGGFLDRGEPALAAARFVESFFSTSADAARPSSLESLLGLNGEKLVFGLDEVSLKSPVTNPRMLRDFLAFETHVQNGWKLRNEPVPEAWYRAPVYYKGNPYTVIGHEEPALWPHYSRKLDYELELACIIGKEGRNIPVEQAGEYIAGFAVMNDFSARDIQKYEMQCRLGPAKGKDFATAVGPWLVTKDEIPDIRNLRMTAKINGELWSDGNSGTMHWTFEQMIAHVSMEETLYPGDILGSGTVGFGCGLELDKWLQPGDVVELEIEGLNILRNQVVQSEP